MNVSKSSKSYDKRDGWIEVQNRRNRKGQRSGGRWDSKKGKEGEADEEICSFFFSEFPEEYNAKEMFEIFIDFSIVVEVVILSKRDK